MPRRQGQRGISPRERRFARAFNPDIEPGGRSIGSGRTRPSAPPGVTDHETAGKHLLAFAFQRHVHQRDKQRRPALHHRGDGGDGQLHFAGDAAALVRADPFDTGKAARCGRRRGICRPRAGRWPCAPRPQDRLPPGRVRLARFRRYCSVNIIRLRVAPVISSARSSRGQGRPGPLSVRVGSGGARRSTLGLRRRHRASAPTSPASSAAAAASPGPSRTPARPKDRRACCQARRLGGCGVCGLFHCGKNRARQPVRPVRRRPPAPVRPGFRPEVWLAARGRRGSGAAGTCARLRLRAAGGGTGWVMAREPEQASAPGSPPARGGITTPARSSAGPAGAGVGVGTASGSV